MLSSLKSYLILAGGVILSLLATAAAVFKGQRDRAQEKADEATKKVESIKVVRKKETAINKSRAEVREKTEEVKKEHEARDSSKRPSGTLRR